MLGSLSRAALRLIGEIIRYIAGHEVPLIATRIYELSFLTGFCVSSIVYYVLNRLFPAIGAMEKFEEVDVSGYQRKRSASETPLQQSDREDGAVESGYGPSEGSEAMKVAWGNEYRSRAD